MTTIKTAQDKDTRLDFMVTAAKALDKKWYGRLGYSIDVNPGGGVHITFTQPIWDAKRHAAVRETCEEFVLDYQVVPLGDKLAITIF